MMQVSLPISNAPTSAPAPHIYAVPNWTAPTRATRRVPLVTRVNRLLRNVLITMCGLALLGYGLDVAASNDVSKLQGQARRLGEQNTELSAQLLRAISFQGIQASVVGRAGLRVPEHVLVVRETEPVKPEPYKPLRHYLPLMSGY